MIKLCLSGSTRAGKDYFAAELVAAFKDLGLEAKTYSIAAEAKNQACALYPERCGEFWAGNKSAEARQIITDMAIRRPHTYYTDFIFKQIKQDQPDVCTVTDGRFEVHFNELLKRNFTFIYIGEDTSQYDTKLFFEASTFKLPYRPSENGFNVANFVKSMVINKS